MRGAGARYFGRHGQRRAELERLLATNTRDTRLLQQLSKLAEEEGDLETAVRYQKLHEDLAESDEGQARLGTLLVKAGDLEEAQKVWTNAAAGKSQSFRVFMAMDTLLSYENPQPVLEITEAMLREDPSDWEAMYRQGIALEQLGKRGEAAARFQKIAELTGGDDQKSALPKNKPRTRESWPRPGSGTQSQHERPCRSATGSPA